MSVNFYLPNFSGYGNMNMHIINLLQQRPDYFYDEVKVAAVYGCFPNCIWNGGRVMIGNQMYTEDMQSLIAGFNQRGVAVRYTYTNCAIEEKHLNDTLCNLTMEAASNWKNKNEVLVNSSILEAYLRENYTNFKYLSSTTKCLVTLDAINNELSKDYSLVVLDFRLNRNDKILEGITNPEKIEILIDAYCSPACRQRSQHYEVLSKAQIGFNHGGSFDCNDLKNDFYDNLKSNRATLKVDELYSKYVPMGYCNFKIEGRTNNPYDVLESYVYYMVKPEYRDEVRLKLIKSMNSNSSSGPGMMG